MKAPPVLAGTLLAAVFLASSPLLWSQSAPAPASGYPSVPPTPPPASPPTPPPPVKDAAKSPPEELKIVGVAIPRADGRWLGLAIEDGNFKLRFYAKDKKPEKPDIARAAARWSPVGKVGDMRVILNPAADGFTLAAPQFVSPPLAFKVYLTLLGPDDQVVDNMVVDIHGP